MNESFHAARRARAETFVRQAYRALLGREADSGGLAMFVSNMLKGSTERQVLDVLLGSDEFKSRALSEAARFFIDRYLQGDRSGRFPLDYQAPGEAGRSYLQRLESGFLDRFCGGETVLDVGFAGYDNGEGRTGVPDAIGIDLNYPGYDGTYLPFAEGSVDTVFSSHCLEHVADDRAVIQDWYRVLKTGGFIVCIVPHQDLYEKKLSLPSRWNMDHKRMFTSSSLLAAFEGALDRNSFRVRHLVENDEGYDYARGPEVHADGAYEIELVVEKIAKPGWSPA